MERNVLTGLVNRSQKDDGPAMPIVTKIVTAVAIVALIFCGRHDCKDQNRDCLCDRCETAMHPANENAQACEGVCAACGAFRDAYDKNGDNICDDCGGYPCGLLHLDAHDYSDGICTHCGGAENPHTDRNADGFCEHCSDAMCRLGLMDHRLAEDAYFCELCGVSAEGHSDRDGNGYCEHCSEPICTLNLGEHQIPENGCACRLCGNVNHREGEHHPFCGICGERLPLDDRDGDGACDVCGEYSCGGSYHGNSNHTDADGDKKCDICHEYMCGLIWGLEHNMDYSDGIYDGKCDDCGHYMCAHGLLPHTDEDADGICDVCRYST